MKHDIGTPLLHHIMERSAMAVLVLDREGRILETNSYAKSLVGRDILRLFLSEVILDFSSTFCLKSCLQNSKDSYLLNLPSIDGLAHTLYFRFYEEAEYILAIGEQHHEEINLLRKNMIDLNHELGNANRDLQKKHAELEKLNELKNQFLGMAAHDLRNPIGTIMTLSDFLLEEAFEHLSSEHIHFLTMIRSSSGFMLNLLNDLLDIAKIEAGRMGLNITPVNLETLIEKTLAFQRFQARKKRVELVFSCYEQHPMVLADSLKIEQVLQNLLTNAIKFSPPEGKVAVNLFGSQGHLTVAVTDQGPGIPADQLSNIFKPFSRDVPPAPEGEKGTGLGLSIVQKIILAHRGSIWVESKPGEGTSFLFALQAQPHEDAPTTQ